MSVQVKPNLSDWISYWSTFDHSRGVTRAVARNFAEARTAGQLAAIRSVSNSQRLDADAECLKIFKCPVEQLCRDAASVFITYLKLPQAEREKAA
jgi:hypothetical protein